MAHLKTVSATTKTWSELSADVIAVGIFSGGKLTPMAKDVDEAVGGQLRSAIKGGDITGRAGETRIFFGKNYRLMAVGLGEKRKLDLEQVRRASGTVARTAIRNKLAIVLMEDFAQDKEGAAQAQAEGVILGSYQFLDYKTMNKDDQFLLKKVTVRSWDRAGLKKGAVIANAVCFARDLGNHPGNVTTPTKLAQEARKIGRRGRMGVWVFDRAKFTKMGMGALAGVAAGTDEPPKFIVMEYWGTKKSEAPKVLVGKGLTFDSGGISIKPASKMDEMKFDMCGSAVVLGTMHALADLRPAINVVGIVPSTENLSGAKAYKPGDILKAYNNKTIEVLNTDAEGRLILADALAYASKHYKPEYILDFATLTGAVIVALGHIATGIMGTDEKLIKKVKASSRVTAEKVWELPLWDDYCHQVRSKVADVKNIGAPMQAGSIAGGAFLKEFVKEGIPWCHFDIAGTAWADTETTSQGKVKEKPYTPSGATGNVIRLVLDLIGS